MTVKRLKTSKWRFWAVFAAATGIVLALLSVGIHYVVTQGLPWWGWVYLAFMLVVEFLLFTKWRP
ncbi:hypothetical protein ES706_05756 [subsurface metagenome]